MSNFKFEHNGEEIEFEKSFAVARSPKWMRANRNRQEIDMVFFILEDLGGEAVCEAVDEMDEKQFEAFVKNMMKAFEKDASAK